MTKIHILGPSPETFVNELSPLFPEVIFSLGSSRNDFGNSLEEYDALFTFSDFLNPDSFKNLNKIRWIQSLGTGLDGMIDSPYLDDTVIISSMRGIHGPQVSELVFMLLLSLSRDFSRAMENQLNKVWERWPGKSLQNKTIGLLGVGVISEAIARRCKAFDMRVIGITRTKRKLNHFDKLVGQSDLITIAKELDYLVALVPLNEETRGIVNKHVFSAMKQSAYFINVARGGVVDENDLVTAINKREIAGAGLDVFEEEPLPVNSPLWSQPNLILTPHLGGMVDVYVEQSMPILTHNIRAFLNGDTGNMLNLVSR
jgi:phosphoglycerate dehydrogenase-like enzyme